MYCNINNWYFRYLQAEATKSNSRCVRSNSNQKYSYQTAITSNCNVNNTHFLPPGFLPNEPCMYIYSVIVIPSPRSVCLLYEWLTVVINANIAPPHMNLFIVSLIKVICFVCHLHLII